MGFVFLNTLASPSYSCRIVFSAGKTFKDKVNKDNIDFYLSEWNDFTSKHQRKNCNDTVIYIYKELKSISKG